MALRKFLSSDDNAKIRQIRAELRGVEFVLAQYRNTVPIVSPRISELEAEQNTLNLIIARKDWPAYQILLESKVDEARKLI